MEARSFLDNLRTPAYQPKSQPIGSQMTFFAVDSLEIMAPVGTRIWDSSGFRTARSMTVSARHYLSLDALMLLSIVAKNIGTRPICFTQQEARFEKYLFHTGMGYQLVPADTGRTANKAAALSATRAFFKSAGSTPPAVAHSGKSLSQYFAQLTARCWAGDRYAAAGDQAALDETARWVLDYTRASVPGLTAGAYTGGSWLLEYGYYKQEVKALLEKMVLEVAEADQRPDDALDENPGGGPMAPAYAGALFSLFKKMGLDTKMLEKTGGID